MRSLIYILSCAALLAGCTVFNEPPPQPFIKPAKPASKMRAECPDLPPIPSNEVNPAVRDKYYETTRPMYGECRDKHRALNKYIDKVTD